MQLLKEKKKKKDRHKEENRVALIEVICCNRLWFQSKADNLEASEVLNCKELPGHFGCTLCSIACPPLWSMQFINRIMFSLPDFNASLVWVHLKRRSKTEVESRMIHFLTCFVWGKASCLLTFSCSNDPLIPGISAYLLVLMTREHYPGHLDDKELFTYYLNSCGVVVQPLRMRRAHDGH